MDCRRGIILALLLLAGAAWADTHNEGSGGTLTYTDGCTISYASTANCTAETTIDGDYCTASYNNDRNKCSNAYWDMSGIDTGDIPSGSTINSVTCIGRTFRGTGDADLAFEATGYNSNTATNLSCTSSQTEPCTDCGDTGDWDFSCQLSSTPSYADLVTNGYIHCRFVCANANDGDVDSCNVYTIYMSVDYTPSAGRSRRFF